MRSLFFAALRFALPISSVLGQGIAGHIAETSGAPVQHVHVTAHPVGDSTETAMRIAISNELGEFKLRALESRAYVLRVRRIGFAAEPDQIVDLSQKPDAQITITLRALAVPLAPVRIAAIEPRCLDANDPAQNPVVREWLDHGLDLLRARRVVERDFRYQVQVSEVRNPARSGSLAHMSYWHIPGGKSGQIREDDVANLVMIADKLVKYNDTDAMPTETTILSPYFLMTNCFMSVPKQSADGTWAIEWRGKPDRSGGPSISGTLTFTPDGLTLDGAQFRIKAGSTESSAHLEFTQVTIDGETYPILSARGNARAPKSRSQGSSIEERYSYSAFARDR